MLVVPDSVSVAVLNELVATGNLFDGAKVHLYKNDYTPSRLTAVGDLVTADFTGYAASAAIVWGAPGIGPDGFPGVVGDRKQFIGGSTFTVPNTIHGYYITDSAGTTLLWVERFASPVIIAATGQTCYVVPTFGDVSQSG